jgi:hypothetical protein
MICETERSEGAPYLCQLANGRLTSDLEAGFWLGTLAGAAVVGAFWVLA